MWIWLPRDAATVDLSGLTATPSTGFTVAGGALMIGLTTTVVPVGGLAPWSIHNLISASSSGANAVSLRGGMYGRTSLPHSLTSRLSADLPGTMAAPRLPPRIIWA